MQGILFYKQRFDRSMILGLKLGVFWFAGLSLGFWAVRFWGDTLVSRLLLAPASAGSAFGCLLVTLLPLLLSACAVFLFRSAGVLAVCFLRALLLGFMLGAVVIGFPSAPFLMASLLLFSGLSGCPVLLWYWWRRLCAGTADLLRDTIVCGLVGLLVGAVDYWFISPFLVDVINL